MLQQNAAGFLRRTLLVILLHACYASGKQMLHVDMPIGAIVYATCPLAAGKAETVDT